MASDAPNLSTEMTETLCGSARCFNCNVWSVDLKTRQRQADSDDFDRSRWRPWECDSCRWYFRRGGWADSHPHWMLHETYIDLESSAFMGCRSCRLFRQAIIYDCPSLADLWALRFERRPVWVIRDERHNWLLRVECRKWPHQGISMELRDDDAGIYFLRFPNLYVLADILPVEYIQPQPDVDFVLDIARIMLDTCVSDSSHVTCMKADALHAMPTRVIDVGDSETLPCLYLPKGRAARYCTLSYCWGANGAWYQTTNDNISERSRSLPFITNGKPMPKTYHDAIIIARCLGIRYLWIDALCIIQDDAEDWQRESAKMIDIYHHSYCTIAATGSTHAEEGILNPRPAQHLTTSEFGFGWKRPEFKYFGQHLGAASPEKGRLVKDAHLNTRGWVLQEGLLSPRILHFTAHCLYFECLSGTSSELDPMNNLRLSEDQSQSIKHRLISEKLHPLIAYEIWWDILHEYTGKSLTKDEDRLPAISGIAMRIQAHIGDQYVAGLWRNNLVEDLQWFTSIDSDTEEELLWSRRPKTFVAPSWSWASVVCQVSSAKKPMVKWETNWDQEIWSLALDIIHVEIKHRQINNVYGQAASGKLRVRGRLRHAHLSRFRTVRDRGLLLVLEDRQQKILENAIRFDIPEPYSEPSSRKDLWCLEVSRCIKSQPTPHPPEYDDVIFDRVCFHALVLQPTGLENQYQRVGFAKLTTKTYFDGCDVQTVDIV